MCHDTREGARDKGMQEGKREMIRGEREEIKEEREARRSRERDK